MSGRIRVDFLISHVSANPDAPGECNVISHNEQSPFLDVNPADYQYPIRWGEAIGIELEYMIVDRETLAVKPIADELLRAVTGAYTTDAEPGGPDFNVGWSNELALHIIELKTARPAEVSFAPYVARFQSDIRLINETLDALGARLMPTAMHPWMDPERELKLWPHEYGPVYHAYNRIFGCRGHGWANLQSTHINLPFGNDVEFGRLHAAIRLVLPILPALAASSPIVEGRVTGPCDNRLIAYRGNAARIPSITGCVVPEPIFARAAYERDILGRMYQDIAEHDPEAILQHEWLNSRGAIARFERGSIEIRVIDIQECPAADLAIVAATVRVIEHLVSEKISDIASQQQASTEGLAATLERTERTAGEAVIDDVTCLRAFGLADERRISVGELWSHLIAQTRPVPEPGDDPFAPTLHVLLTEGCLARRIVRATGQEPDRARLHEVYRELCDCLHAGRLFVP